MSALASFRADRVVDLLASIGEGREWRSLASCREVEADLFHPVGWSWDSDGARVQLARARTVCAGCPVRRPCLDDAMERGDGWSVRAGTTPEERRALGAQLTRSAR